MKIRAFEDVVYQISADWRELRPLDGKDFIYSTGEANENWMVEYIPVFGQSYRD